MRILRDGVPSKISAELSIRKRVIVPFQSCRHARKAITSHSRGPLVRPQALPEVKASEAEEEEELKLEGISQTYCDDFVCTSSPQVEQNAKALARETTRLTTWSRNLFRKDVLYKDKFLSFRGTDRYGNLYFVKSCVQQPKVLVTRLRMLEKGCSQVEWRLRGSIGAVPIDVALKSTFVLDLITGRVKEHNEEWDLSKCSPPGKAAFTASRLVWSAVVKASHLKEDAQNFIKDKFQSDDQPNITVDPNDPMKFYQDDLDPTKDLLSIGAIIAFIYFIFKAYGEIEKL